MSIAKEQFDWYFLEEDRAVEGREEALGWQAVADEEADGRGRETPGQGHAPQRLYELLFGIALVYGVAVYLIWQQAAQQLAELKQEMVALQSEVVHEQVTSTENVSAEEARLVPLKQLGYGFDMIMTGRAIKPQWEAMTLALQLYLQLENGHNPHWRSNTTLLERRHLAQNRSIELVHQMITGWQTQTDQQLQLSPTAYAVADPLIEYIFETYDNAHILLLLAAFEKYDSWETLAPVVFDVNADELEENWHLYLKQKYPLPDR